jgi:hypothetical protein
MLMSEPCYNPFLFVVDRLVIQFNDFMFHVIILYGFNIIRFVLLCINWFVAGNGNAKASGGMIRWLETITSCFSKQAPTHERVSWVVEDKYPP